MRVTAKSYKGDQSSLIGWYGHGWEVRRLHKVPLPTRYGFDLNGMMPQLESVGGHQSLSTNVASLSRGYRTFFKCLPKLAIGQHPKTKLDSKFHRERYIILGQWTSIPNDIGIHTSYSQHPPSNITFAYGTSNHRFHHWNWPMVVYFNFQG